MRRINSREKKLLTELIQISGKFYSIEEIEVSELKDDGMGSLYLGSSNLKDKRFFGKRVAEAEYLDNDKIPIIVSLNVDQFDDLFELDIWKVDYSKVNKYPEPDSN
ncbi:MAG: hypothetical protein AAGI25_06425 [Bacteroidota bacterium]